MKVSADKLDKHRVVLEMEVPQAEVTKAFDKAYQKLADRVNIPGFRKGKVPRQILEKRIGKEAFQDEVFEIIAPFAYARALKEQNVEPVSRPEIEVVTLEEGKPMVFKATVITKPEVTLGEYKGVKVSQPAVRITEKEVNAQLDALRSRHAKMVVVKDVALEKGDFAVIDFKGFIDGEAFKGGEAESYPLEIGSGSFIPGFEEQLIGAKPGEEREIKLAFPEDYFAAEMAGKEAMFQVKVQDIKRKELPELDDDFAKDSGEFSTIEELKADIKNKLKQNAKQKSERDFHNNAIKAALDNAEVDIPEIMVEDRIDNMIEDLNVNLQNRGMQLAKYMEHLKMDMETLRKNYEEAALMSVKTDLVLDAVVKSENMEATTEDIEAEIAAMAEGYETSAEEVRKIVVGQGQMPALTSSVLRKKAAKFIVDNAVKG